MKKILMGITALVLSCACLTACGSYGGGFNGGVSEPDALDPDGNFGYDSVIEQDFSSVTENDRSEERRVGKECRL